MSLMQQAYDTYGYAEKDRAGVYYAEENEPLAPIGHTITKAAIEITIDGDGSFLQANAVAKDDEKTIFPVTEDSAGRTSKPVAHPLCDQLQYLLPQYKDKNKLYVDQLSRWNDSAFKHPITDAVLRYVTGGTIKDDLEMAGLLTYDNDGKLKNEKDFVRWIVTDIGDDSGPCWKNRKLQNCYSAWYQSIQEQVLDVCMVSGERTIRAKQHAKGVVSLKGNAKLISANDSSGFTYRGRFLDDTEAANVSYEISQKLHNALRWVIANQGVYYGGRCFVCWNPQGKEIPRVQNAITRRRGKPVAPVYTPTAYREQIRSALNSWTSELPKDAKAVTAVFDAATTGRLALTYYSELEAADFAARLAWWDETCCWPNGDFGIQPPTLSNIATFAFGTLRTDSFEADENIMKQVMVQLLTSRVEKGPIPTAFARNLVQKSGNLQIVPDDKEHKYLRRTLLFTTCAVIRKYHIDHYKEEWSMALEPEKRDRSYQFGRLMAIMEKIERDTYDADDKRETNIIRRQMAFVARPYATTASVQSHLKNAYYPQLSVTARNYYEKLIEEIMEILSEDGANLNRPLEDTYLLGYYLQKKELYTSRKEKVEE